MLLPRILTALVGVPILLGAIYFGSLPFFFVMLAILILGQREFYYLAKETGYPCYEWTGVGAGALLATSVFLNGMSFGNVTENQGTSAVLSLIVIVVCARSIFSGPRDTTLSEWAVTFFGVIYVSWSLSHLILLRDLRPQGQAATFYLFILIWVEDVCAYFVGTRWGKHPIAPAISPKKTWEGTIGGLVGAVLVSAAFQAAALRQQMNLAEAIALGLVTGILAFVSDLVESMLKRGAGLKDSSTLLPGHGGVLDRFDSFILTAPFFYYYWALVKH